MKKVAIITLNGGDNYGNVLQNYAVQETLKELGTQPETVVNTTSYGRFYLDTKKVNKLTVNYVYRYFRDKLNYKYNIKNSGKGILKTIKFCKQNSSAISLAKKARTEGFEAFRNSNIVWAKDTININKLWKEEQTEKYDFFVSGSDQVWNPVYPSTSAINFLQFAPEHKRITFSPSFGIGEIPQGLREEYSKWLSSIPFLSVREEKGKEIIKELCGKDATLLCDPTMCLTKEKWLEIAKKPKFDTEKPYILTYFLGDRTKEYDKFIEKVAKEHNLRVIHLFDVLDLEHYATSPHELIYLINNAKLVCTDSFHGTVFSIIMNTNFVAMPRVESGKSMNSRMETLLGTFGLEQRGYKNVGESDLFATNFASSKEVLDRKREEVFEFLKIALESEPQPIENAKKDSVLPHKEMCCGCTACEGVCPVNCITMEIDSEGFKYPKIDLDKCIDCKKCEKVCPSWNKNLPQNNVGEHSFIGHSKNSEVRKNSSSGGIFYHLAKKVIDENGVVFGAAMVGRQVKHTFAETKEEIKRFMGSKYVQSDMGDCYKRAKEFLESGRKVLFSGTPCQIKGLYAYLGKEYGNLLTQDLICHGVPSPMVWDKYLSFKTKSEHPQVSFRDKKYGWHYFSLKIKDGKKVSIKTLENDWYLKLFSDNTILRLSCYECNAKEQGSSADITIADCWNLKKICRDISDKDEGLSLILANSKKGQEFLGEISEEVYLKEVDSEKALASQSAISKSAPCNPKRAMFFEAIDKVSIEYLYKNWYKKSFIRGIKKRIVFCKFKLKH